MKKVKIFISVGMRGRTKEAILADIQRAKERIMRDLTEDHVEIVHTFVTEPPEDKRRLACLGESIKILGECDICYLCTGYHKYSGCMVEKTICELYNIGCYYEGVHADTMLTALIKNEIDKHC